MSAQFHHYRLSSTKLMLNYVIVVLFSPSRLLKKNRIPTPQSGKSLARFYYVTDKRRPVSPVLVRAGARR